MPYDETLAERVRALFQSEPGCTERKLFGFMVGGNMAVGITGINLMVRPGPDDFEDALELPHARPMDFTGRPMKGFVYVEPAGLTTKAALAEWVERGVRFARSLPAK